MIKYDPKMNSYVLHGWAKEAQKAMDSAGCIKDTLSYLELIDMDLSIADTLSAKAHLQLAIEELSKVMYE